MRPLSVLLWMLVARSAIARTPDAFEGEDEMDLTPTSVRAHISGSTVELVARFGFDVAGSSYEVNGRTIQLPAGAVVTGGVATVEGKSHRLVLMPAISAQKAMDAIEAAESKTARQWALHLSTSGAASVSIDIAAATTAHVTLELTAEMPSCFYRDDRYVALPKTWFTRLPTPRREIRDRALDATCGELAEEAEWIAFPARDLARKPAGEPRVGMLAGLLPLAGVQFSRVEIDLARELTDVPADLHTAIVIDSSRSLTTEEIETQRALVASYVAHLPPQSRVQIIAYARDAKALLPTWLPAGSAAPRIDREIRGLSPRNGSNADAGIMEGIAWLGRVSGTRRLIVVGDDRLPSRIDDQVVAAIAKQLPPAMVVHAVDVSDIGGGLARREGLTFGPLATATEGLAVGASLDENKAIDATMLVRPTSIDAIAIAGPGWKVSDEVGGSCVAEMSVGEGSSCTWWGVADGTAGPITLDATIWGHKIHRIMRPNPLDAIHIARELTVQPVLGEDRQRLVDDAAHAVNAAWSLFGSWGGPGGYADGDGFGRGGFGHGGSCCGDVGIGDIGHGSGTGGRLDVSAQLAPAIAQCHATSATVDVQLELTREEIVDVRVSISPANDAQRACIVEHIWDTSLSIANAPTHTTSLAHFKP